PATALAVLTGSIAWVVLLRPFYYVQIGPLGVCRASGLTAAQARAAYNDVMDYCLGLRPDFAAGVLPFSAEGASHFAD
ncbi:MAG TPA: TIGR01906 family membrane protein, partial [Oscillibacter sp.]|nr:TIGR01906 family membrane protein [Oscillibacter sp.]